MISSRRAGMFLMVEPTTRLLVRQGETTKSTASEAERVL